MSGQRAPAAPETDSQRLARLDRTAAQLGRARRASRSMSKRYYGDLSDAAAKPETDPKEKQ